MAKYDYVENQKLIEEFLNKAVFGNVRFSELEETDLPEGLLKKQQAEKPDHLLEASPREKHFTEEGLKAHTKELGAEVSRLNRENSKLANQINNQAKTIQENQLQIAHLKELSKYSRETLDDAIRVADDLTLENKHLKELLEKTSDQMVDFQNKCAELHQNLNAVYKDQDGLKAQLSSTKLALDTWKNYGDEASKRYLSLITDICNVLGLNSDIFKSVSNWPQLLDKIVQLNKYKNEARKAWDTAFRT